MSIQPASPKSLSLLDIAKLVMAFVKFLQSPAAAKLVADFEVIVADAKADVAQVFTPAPGA